MQTKLSSLHFMVFIKGPHKGSPGKKERRRKGHAGVKTPTKNFYCRVEKICRSDEKLSKNAHS